MDGKSFWGPSFRSFRSGWGVRDRIGRGVGVVSETWNSGRLLHPGDVRGRDPRYDRRHTYNHTRPLIHRMLGVSEQSIGKGTAPH